MAPPLQVWSHELSTAVASNLPEFLLTQRWYPAKDAGRPAVELSTLIPFPVTGIPAAVALWRVTPPGLEPFLLFVPLALVAIDEADPAQVIAAPPTTDDRGRATRLVEAFSVEAFVRAWVEALLRPDAEFSLAGGRLRTGQTPQLSRAGLEPGGSWAIRRSSAEQSNTSIRIGDRAILKAIRKLETGIHPELEVSRFLTGSAGFAATPALLGWTALPGAESPAEDVTLSLMQTFVPNEGDGWSWVLEHLSRDTKGPSEATSWIRQLGRRTAEMHAAFACETDDPSFRPEPVGGNDIRTWVALAEAIAHRAFDGLAKASSLDPATQDLARTVLARRDDANTRLHELLGMRASFKKARHHGDYHLGQVLVTRGDAVIIDFEGEPLRPLAERRAKHAALRDVAGMLRSLSYAAAAAYRGLPQDVPVDQRQAVQQRLSAWDAKAAEAFLDAYFETARGGDFCPKRRADADRLVRFFMLEKALYEVAYELANRPDWLAIPLRGVLSLLAPENTPPAARAHRMPFGA